MAQFSVTMDYGERPRVQVTKDVAFTLTAKAYLSGTQLVVTAATITIKMPGGGALPTPVVAQAATVDGSGNMSYAFTAANAAQLGANYSAVWTFTVGATTYAPAYQLFDVVRFPLVNPVKQSDLTKYHPDLTDALYASESNAQLYIEEAYIDVWYVLDSKGKRPYLLLSSEDLRRPIEHLALSRFFLPRIKQDGDRWSGYQKHHQAEYERWIQTANFAYDADDSGTIDGTSEYGSIAGEEGRGAGFGWRV